MKLEEIAPNRALVWKDLKLLRRYAFLFIVFAGFIAYFILEVGGIPGTQIEGLIAYAPFVMAVLCGACTISSIAEEITDRTMEALLCTPLGLKEVLVTKIMVITLLPCLAALIFLIPALLLPGGWAISWAGAYQMIADFPMAVLFTTAAATTWFLRTRRLYRILSWAVGAIFFLSIFGYFGALKLFLGVDLPVSPLLTTLFLLFSVPALLLMYRRIGSFEKSEVI